MQGYVPAGCFMILAFGSLEGQGPWNLEHRRNLIMYSITHYQHFLELLFKFVQELMANQQQTDRRWFLPLPLVEVIIVHK